MSKDNLLQIKVTPKSSKNRIVVTSSDEIKVYVTAPPENGEANQACCELLAKNLGVSKSSVQIESGHTSRQKRIRLETLSAEEALSLLKNQFQERALPGLN